MTSHKVLGMIMAGGKGQRLLPLTAARNKAAVPFGGQYRIIDFVLSNFVNSGIHSVYVLVQYKSQSLIEHVREAWHLGGRNTGSFISIVPPQMRAREGWYEGTADAVYQNLNLIEDFSPDVIAVFGADHIYRMDIRQMVLQHVACDADVTVATLPVPVKAATGFGIVEADAEGRIIGFEEKPMQPKPMPGQPDYALSSIGNYLFKPDVLMPLLKRDASRPGTHDFGRNIVPELVAGGHCVKAYDVLSNDIPGLRAYEERGYWRDVGTVESYWQANMDLLGETPRFDLRNPGWPILSGPYDGPMASLVRTRVVDSMIGQGSYCIDADIDRSIVGRGVRIDAGAQLEGCILLDGVHIGSQARLRRVIVDRSTAIPPRSLVGINAVNDVKRFQGAQSDLIVLSRTSVGPDFLRHAS
ncbi:MAG: glucose-1-phosphate adenylyltransferase [Nitrospirae bacterium]|nr:glucose-1-phosphate adenylyltransferase [Nitrospirota bacterium]